MIAILCSLVYVTFRIVPADVVIVGVVVLGLFVAVIRLKWLRLRDKGNCC